MSEIAVRNYVRQALLQGTLPHALLFSGPKQALLLRFVEELGRELLGFPQQTSPPDLHRIVPENKSHLHSMEAVREMINEAHTAPFQASCKVFLICQADRMQTTTANALLKVLEEPPPRVFFLLSAAMPQEMLPTLLSRCTHLRLEGGGAEALIPCAEALATLVMGPQVPYFRRVALAEEIEAWMDDDEPMEKVAKFEQVLQYLTSCYRERQPEALEEILDRLGEARFLFSRHIKVSVILTDLVSAAIVSAS